MLMVGLTYTIQDVHDPTFMALALTDYWKKI